jgi:RNA polymerase sigma-70 factor (ECF subfamily)
MVTDPQWLADQFEQHRTHLRGMAHRMLGSPAAAEDAVQEAWLRLSRSDTSGVENLRGWLTTVVARVCLDALRSRKTRREESLEISERPAGALDPEHETLLADSIGSALLAVLETLPPAERVAFVLHDSFDLSFEEIAPIVGRTPVAARKLASRARQRMQGPPGIARVDRDRKQEVVSAFLAASRGGELGALLALLDPDAVLRADPVAVRMGAQAEVRGARAVAETFKGRAQAAQLAIVDGAAGAVWWAGGEPRVVFGFTILAGSIVAIDLLADPDRLRLLDLKSPEV